jgi:hypothetical protein
MFFSPSSSQNIYSHLHAGSLEVVGNYTGIARGVTMEILHMLCPGLGPATDATVCVCVWWWWGGGARAPLPLGNTRQLQTIIYVYCEGSY